MAPGHNFSRRAFVELAAASAFGASLVGLSAGPAAAAETQGAKAESSDCVGQGLGGWGQTIEYEDLAKIHRSAS